MGQTVRSQPPLIVRPWFAISEKAMDPTRANPDELLKQVKAEEQRQRRGKLKIFFGAAAGVGKTYAMLEAAQARKAEGLERRRRHRRNPRPRRDRGAPRGPRSPAAALRGIPRHEAARVRPRRRAGAQAGADPRGRAGAHQRARQPPRQALAGRRRAARRRHRRLHHAQRAAPRKPERRRPADHRRRRPRDRPRLRLRAGRRDRADRPAARRPAPAPERGQGLPPRAGGVRRREFLPQGQPHRAARAGAALDRRPRQPAGARLPRRAGDQPRLADRRAAPGLRQPQPVLRAAGARGAAHGRGPARGMDRHHRRAAEPLRRRQGGAGGEPQPGRAARRRDGAADRRRTW